MASIQGRFQYEEPFHPALSDVLRPVVNVSVRIGDSGARFELQIDTGADYTVLQPTEASIILGEAYDRIDFNSDPARFDLYGISGAGTPFVIRTATLTFLDEVGAEIAFELPVLIAAPSTPLPTTDSNWEAPSLLGQDALRRFDLQLSYPSRSVSLTEAVSA